MRNFLKMFLLVNFIAGLCSAQTDFQFPEFGGFSKSDSVKIYTPENLWDLIDGAADSFLKYDFQKLFLQRYEGADDKLLKIEIYKHLDHANAFGKYSNEKPYETDWVKIGAAGYYEEGILNFYKGKYYVKISSFNMKTDRELIMNAAERIASMLEGSVNPPELSTKFPAEGKVANSERYVNENYLGYSQFTKVFTAEYEFGDLNFNLFVAEKHDSAAVEKMLRDYAKAVELPEPVFGDKVIKFADPYQGALFMQIIGNRLIGTVNIEEENTAIKYLNKFDAEPD